MDNSQVLKESIENLYHFEYYKFRKSFGLAFLVIGILHAIIYIFDYYNNYISRENNTYYNVLVLINLILILIICLFLGYIVKTLKKTRIENGKLIKSKTLIGILIIVFGILFFGTIADFLTFYILSSIDPHLLFLGYDIIVDVNANIFILIGLYYVETKLFFPNEHSASLKFFSIITMLFFIISSGILLLVIPNPNFISLFFNSSFQYELLIAFISAILLILYGLFEKRSLSRFKRDLHE